VWSWDAWKYNISCWAPFSLPLMSLAYDRLYRVEIWRAIAGALNLVLDRYLRPRTAISSVHTVALLWKLAMTTFKIK